jgi:hypothetical protein
VYPLGSSGFITFLTRLSFPWSSNVFISKGKVLLEPYINSTNIDFL